MPAATGAISPEEFPIRHEEKFFHFNDICRPSNSDNNMRAGDEQIPATEQYTIPYQMSCRNCQNHHNHIKYSGVFSCKNAEDSKQALKTILEQHFFQIWKIVHEEDGSISSSVHPDEWNGEESNVVEFLSSSLARHTAKHCQSFTNKEDVSKWCKDNIKVEVQQGLDTHVPPSEKRKSKGGKKHKKRGKSKGSLSSS